MQRHHAAFECGLPHEPLLDVICASVVAVTGTAVLAWLGPWVLVSTHFLLDHGFSANGLMGAVGFILVLAVLVGAGILWALTAGPWRLGRAWMVRHEKGQWTWWPEQAADAGGGPLVRTGRLEVVMEWAGWCLIQARPLNGRPDWMLVRLAADGGSGGSGAALRRLRASLAWS